MLSIATFSRRAVAPASRLLAPAGARLLDRMDASFRWYSAPSKKFVVINTVGVDRPGIVADVTRIVTDKGGNVGESRAQLLGGHFSLMMLVEIQASEMEDLHNNLQSGVGGMTTTCFDAIDPRAVEVSPKIGFSGMFKVSGADNPGIVHKVTSVLARHSLTIGNMKTHHEEAPFGGTELFTMLGRTVAYEPLASHFDWQKIQAELQDLGDSMNCDIEFRDTTESSTSK